MCFGIFPFVFEVKNNHITGFRSYWPFRWYQTHWGSVRVTKGNCTAKLTMFGSKNGLWMWTSSTKIRFLLFSKHVWWVLTFWKCQGKIEDDKYASISKSMILPQLTLKSPAEPLNLSCLLVGFPAESFGKAWAVSTFWLQALHWWLTQFNHLKHPWLSICNIVT